MINYIQKDITTVEQGIVVHGCNCKGVMGSGVALAIRKKWPSAYEAYTQVCKMYDYDRDMLGVAHFVTVEHGQDGIGKIIVGNLITQFEYGRGGLRYADLEAIATSVDQAFRMAAISHLPLYMPRIGCGLGGLKWDTEVGPVVEKIAGQFPLIEVNVCDIT